LPLVECFETAEGACCALPASFSWKGPCSAGRTATRLNLNGAWQEVVTGGRTTMLSAFTAVATFSTRPCRRALGQDKVSRLSPGKVETEKSLCRCRDRGTGSSSPLRNHFTIAVGCGLRISQPPNLAAIRGLSCVSYSIKPALHTSGGARTLIVCAGDAASIVQKHAIETGDVSRITLVRLFKDACTFQQRTDAAGAFHLWAARFALAGRRRQGTMEVAPS
jgi:hypothetical protein